MLEDAERFRFFQHYVGVAFVKRGEVVRQVPVSFGNRHAGESFINYPFRFALAAMLELPRAVGYYRIVSKRARASRA